MNTTDETPRGRPAPSRLRRDIERALLIITLASVLIGAALVWAGVPGAGTAWALAACLALGPAVWWSVADLRAGRLGADVLAVAALAGTLAVGEYLAGAVVGVMLASGRLLDTLASTRAERDLTALVERVPRRATRRRDGRVEQVDVDDVAPGDLVVVLTGELVGVDGRLTVPGTLDESALTGESAPVRREVGELVRSGVVNAGGVLELVATASAQDSTYAGVVRMVERAMAGSSPTARLADRMAAVFLPVAVGLACLAWWLSGDAVRAVAVLVTATPCPLLLAVPIAITSGMSRAARHQVIVRDGTALEALGRVSVAVLDKTGTVTTGHPEITDILTAPGWSRAQVLRLAAAVEQSSPHIFARTIVAAAGLDIPEAGEVTDDPGIRTSGVVTGRRVEVGRSRLASPPEWARAADTRAGANGAPTVWVTIDDLCVGLLVLTDPIRSDSAHTLDRLRAAGLRRLILLTGDRREVARDVADRLGFDDVAAEVDPAGKIDRIRAERSHGLVLMVGDGLNDAPALVAADIGVALGAGGSAATVLAADAVITGDRLDRLADVVELARRCRRIAVSSALIGMGLSLVAMILAAAGLLTPVAGAFTQEAIDLLVILNALRALLPTRRSRSR